MKVKINQLREEVEECVRSLDLERAQALKKELEELEKESSVIDLNFSTSEEVCILYMSGIQIYRHFSIKLVKFR